MKLKQHCEDIADLRLMADAHVQDIADRLLNLIRMAEQVFEEYCIPDSDKRPARVLKDAEK